MVNWTCAFSQSESGKYLEWIIIYFKGLGAWNEPWYRCPWRNIYFITWIDLVSSMQSLARMLNHAALCYYCTCISLKNYREISHGWIFCFLSCETRSSTRFLIACSWFTQESRLATDCQLTFEWYCNRQQAIKREAYSHNYDKLNKNNTLSMKILTREFRRIREYSVYPLIQCMSDQ